MPNPLLPGNLLPGLFGYRYLLVPVYTTYPGTIYFARAEHYKTWSEASARLQFLKEETALLEGRELEDMMVMVFTAQEG